CKSRTVYLKHNSLTMGEEILMTGRFAGKVAFITGGSRGIGKGITQQFAEEGAKVALIDVNEEALQETAEEFKAKGYDIYTKVADVTQSEEIESAMKEVVSAFGSLDILVIMRALSATIYYLK